MIFDISEHHNRDDLNWLYPKVAGHTMKWVQPVCKPVYLYIIYIVFSFRVMVFVKENTI